MGDQSSVLDEDPRFIRSRRTIAKALTELMARSMTTPSVSTVAAAAGIHRATFYNHFESVEEAAVYVITDDFRVMRTLDFGDRELDADPTAVAMTTLNAMLDSLRQRRNLFLLASTYRAPSGLMGMGDLLLDQVRNFRRAFAGSERRPDAHNLVEDVYTASGMNGVLSAAVAGAFDVEPEQTALLLYAALPGWMRAG